MYDLPADWQHPDVLQAIRHDPYKRCALDAGAHRGIITRLLLKHYPTVVAVEPTALCKLVPPTAHRHNAALGRVAGQAGLQAGTENTGQTHLVPGDEVQVLTLDHLCEKHLYAPSFIKIDVEGMECDVLLGGEQTIRRLRPVIMVEENGLGERYGYPLGSVHALLSGWGFRQLAVLHQWRVGADYLYGW